MEIDIALEDPRWDALGLPALAESAARAVIARLELPENVEISLLGADDARIAALNTEFRGLPRPTNVLSWPATELAAGPGLPPATPPPDPFGAPLFLGDIALAWETCMAEAASGGLPPAHHVTHLLVHAILHLLGYDHESDADAALMEPLETEILGILGIADPY